MACKIILYNRAAGHCGSGRKTSGWTYFWALIRHLLRYPVQANARQYDPDLEQTLEYPIFDTFGSGAANFWEIQIRIHQFLEYPDPESPIFGIYRSGFTKFCEIQIRIHQFFGDAKPDSPIFGRSRSGFTNFSDIRIRIHKFLGDSDPDSQIFWTFRSGSGAQREEQ